MSSPGVAVKSYVAPIHKALQQLQYWLARDQTSRLLIAAHTRRELNRRHWPGHVKVSAAGPLHRRVAARGPRRSAFAYWPDDAYEAARHPFLICVLQGLATLRLADYALHCRAGDWVFVPPGLPRSTHPHLPPESRDGHCELLWFKSDAAENQFYAWICHSQPNFHESGPEYGACRVGSGLLTRQFSILCDELLHANDQALTSHLLAGVLLLLRREIERGHAFLPRHHDGEQRAATARNPRNPIEKACLYIHEHLDQPLTVARLTRHVCVSPTLFNREFRRHTGRTFHTYLTACRLEKASVLLRETDTPVNVVSRLVGLHYSQLRRLYYEHHGCTPGEFRKSWIRQNSERPAPE